MCLQGTHPRERYGLGPCDPGYFPRLFPAVVSRVLLYFGIDGIVVFLFFLHQEFVVVVFSADCFFSQDFEEALSLSSQIKNLTSLPPLASSAASLTAAATAADTCLTSLHGCINCRLRLGLLQAALALVPQLKEATLDIYGSCDHPSFASCLNVEATLDRQLGSFDAAIAKFKVAIRLLQVRYNSEFQFYIIVNFSCMLQIHPEIS
jgi:hypothetical protein